MCGASIPLSFVLKILSGCPSWEVVKELRENKKRHAPLVFRGFLPEKAVILEVKK
jgi:hypothetical protein